MTNKDASFLLGACRPNGADSADPEFSEALAQAGRDPELNAWFQAQRAADTAIAARLQSIPVPADLRSRILTGGRVSRPRPWFSTRDLLAIAAGLMIMAGLGTWYAGTGSHRSPSAEWHLAGLPRPVTEWQDTALATLSQLVAGKTEFDAKSPNVTDLQQWLRTKGAPVASAMPASLHGMPSLGCKTISWNSYPTSIICFHAPGGELVHLAMTVRAGIADSPPEGWPLYATRDGWQTACWTQGDMTMMLVTKAPESQLRALLSIALPF